MTRSPASPVLWTSFLFLLGSSIASAGVGVWTTNGPEGATVMATAADPLDAARILAGTSSAGIFRSADAGQTWSFLGLPGQAISAIVFDPLDASRLLVAAGGTLFRSGNRGSTWRSDSQGLPTAPPPGACPVELSAPAFDSLRSSVAYIGWSSRLPGPYATVYTFGGVLRTLDGGASFAPLGPVEASVASVSVDPGNSAVLYALVVRTGAYHTPGSIVKSSDGGTTWSDLLTGQPFNDYSSLVVDPHRTGWLYVSTQSVTGESPPTLLRSTDGGATWSPFASSLDGIPAGLAIDPADSNVLYLNLQRTTSSGLLRSSDGGMTWTDVLGSPLRVLAIAAADHRRLYGGLEDGMTTSGDSGLTWRSSRSGLVATAIPLIEQSPFSSGLLYAVDDRTTGAGGALGGVTLRERHDAVSAWSGLSVFASLPRSLTADPSDPSTLWAGDPGCVGLLRSADGGKSFASTSLGFGCIGPLAFEPGNPRVVYAPNSFASLTAGVLKSEDGGGTWTYADAGLHRDALVVAIDTQNPRTLYQGRVFEGVFKSVDGAVSWRASSDGLPPDASGAVRVQALMVDLQAPSTLYAGLGSGGVFKSSDAAGHWSSASEGLAAGTVFALVADPTDSRRLYAATDAGVFVSSDGAAHWTALNAGLTNLTVRGLLIDPSGRFLHAATLGGGVFDIEIIPQRELLKLLPGPRPAPRRVRTR